MSRALLFDPRFPRSSLFLLPIILPQYGAAFDNVRTHIALEGSYSFQDHRLVVSYVDRAGALYFCVGGEELFASPYYEKELRLATNEMAFVFNLSGHQQDWNHFVEGRYAQFSLFLKERIKEFFGDGRAWDYVETFLYPEKPSRFQPPWYYYEGSHGSGFNKCWVGSPADRYDLSTIELLRLPTVK